MRGLSSSELHSHPDKKLRNHLSEVGDLCRSGCDAKDLNFLEIGLDSAALADIANIIGVCHDFGKSTTYFQEYLNEEDKKKKASLRSRDETKHGLISAVFTWHVLTEFLVDREEVDSLTRDMLPYLGYGVVKRHHGDLGDLSDEVRSLNEKAESTIKKQINAINSKKILDVYRGLVDEETVFSFLRSPESSIGSIKRNRRKTVQRAGGEGNFIYAILIQFLYSVLINADKTDASGIFVERNTSEISPDLVDQYRETLDPNGRINAIRNEIYDEVTGRVETLDLSQKIYSLNVPTGTGKTLTSLSFALKLRKRIRDESGYSPRLIYCLPFMSIIDQNFDVFTSVYDEVTGEKPPTDLLLKHHHLAEFYFKTRDNEFSPDESAFLIEGWNSEIIVTTFVQFFHTLISNKNRALRKYHNIANSIVLLDEVQSIPHRYWTLIQELFTCISRCLNIYFVFITATQPLIFGQGEIIELAENRDKYFRAFERVEMIPCLVPIGFEDFKEQVLMDVRDNPDRDILVVLNTIRASQDLYTYLRNNAGDEATYYYLSTNIIPKERLLRIRNIKKRSGRQVIISTQMVEAGVDIDVDIVFRDFATLDSLNQVAGRCNRNDGGVKGQVKVFILVDEHDKKYYQYIYNKSPVLIEKTKEALSGHEIIDEPEFPEIADRYYRLVKDVISDDESRSLVSHFVKMDFEKIQTDFDLIKEDFRKIDVFIGVDEYAEEIWQRYLSVRAEPDHLKRKQVFIQFRKDFYEYVISVPYNYRNSAGYDEEMRLGHITLDEIEQGLGYDLDSGFIREKSGTSGCSNGTLMM